MHAVRARGLREGSAGLAGVRPRSRRWKLKRLRLLLCSCSNCIQGEQFSELGQEFLAGGPSRSGQECLLHTFRRLGCRTPLVGKGQTKHTVDRLNLVGLTSPASPANSPAAQQPISPTISVQPFVKPAWSRADYYRLTVSANPRVPLLQ